MAALLLFVGFLVVMPSSASAAVSEEFFIDGSFHRQGLKRIAATERDANQSMRVYAEDAWWNALTPSEQAEAQRQIAVIVTEFHGVIAPGLRAFFGSDPQPGVDGDSRLTLMFENLASGLGGYVRERDGVTRDRHPESNEREIIHLNAALLLQPQRMPAFLAHEFQHWITWQQKNILQGVQEEIWINEGRSEYAPTVLGYDDEWEGSHLQARAAAYLKTPEESLLEWKGDDHDYGHVSLFMQYLAEQFGRETVAQTAKSGTGIAAVNDAVFRAGGDRRFQDVFSDWVIANYLNNSSSNPRWRYQRRGLSTIRVQPSRQILLRGPSTASVAGVVKDWGAQWVRFSSAGSADGDVLRVTFEHLDRSKTFAVFAVLEHTDGTAAVQAVSVANGKGEAMVTEFGTDVVAVTMIVTQQTAIQFPATASAGIAQYSLQAERRHGRPITLEAVTPSVVSALGGTRVFVRGSGFVDGASVVIGSSILKATVATDRILSFVAPAGVAGTVTVRVTLPDGQAAELPDALMYEGNGAMIPVSVPEPAPPAVQGIPVGIVDGDLIRARGDIDVYIVKIVAVSGGSLKRFKRLILNPDIFNSYGHLRWENIKEVEPDALPTFTTSALVRAVDDSRVWELFPNGDEGAKRWLKISAEAFSSSGRDWNAVYLINRFERALYREGAPIVS